MIIRCLLPGNVIMSCVIADCEYTTWPGALESGWKGANQHREIVQIGAVRLDAQYRELASMALLVKPKINPVLSGLFCTLTGGRG
jgi:hypothetical protein